MMGMVNVLREQQVLRLDPVYGQGEVVREGLDKDRVGERLAMLCSAPQLGIPVLEHLERHGETRRDTRTSRRWNSSC